MAHNPRVLVYSPRPLFINIHLVHDGLLYINAVHVCDIEQQYHDIAEFEW